MVPGGLILALMSSVASRRDTVDRVTYIAGREEHVSGGTEEPTLRTFGERVRDIRYAHLIYRFVNYALQVSKTWMCTD